VDCGSRCHLSNCDGSGWYQTQGRGLMMKIQKLLRWWIQWTVFIRRKLIGNRGLKHAGQGRRTGVWGWTSCIISNTQRAQCSPIIKLTTEDFKCGTYDRSSAIHTSLFSQPLSQNASSTFFFSKKKQKRDFLRFWSVMSKKRYPSFFSVHAVVTIFHYDTFAVKQRTLTWHQCNYYTHAMLAFY